jgi:hypothetical protein
MPRPRTARRHPQLVVAVARVQFDAGLLWPTRCVVPREHGRNPTILCGKPADIRHPTVATFAARALREQIEILAAHGVGIRSPTKQPGAYERGAHDERFPGTELCLARWVEQQRAATAKQPEPVVL